jgi:hypothetical protein
MDHEKRIEAVEPKIYELAIRWLEGEPLRTLTPESNLSLSAMRKELMQLCQLIGRRKGHLFDTFQSTKPWRLKLIRLIRAEYGRRFPTQCDSTATH